MSYFEYVKGETPDEIAKDLSNLAQNEGKFPCGNLFCSTKGDTLFHGAAKKKMPGHVPEKLIYAAVGKDLDELSDHINDLNQQADYVVMGNIFYWPLEGTWIQMMVLKRFGRLIVAD